ncbi:hypothetical protein Q7P37_008478 [Cladosporium fusiforme]
MAMIRAIKQWAQELDEAPSEDAINDISKHLGKSYTIYGTMLILPPSLFDSKQWGVVTAQGHPATQHLYGCIAKHLKISHIACTQPIPLHDNVERTENVIRSPKNFTPLYGDFGPDACSDPPSGEDFDAAYWVTAKQNGIAQTWAPRWTMFSRGNISEKQRVLELPSVKMAVEEGQDDSTGCAAVDLYAGIGYFTFSYLKAGFSKVLCWDINPWSTEGLRRGATANKWQPILSTNEMSLTDMARSNGRCLIFNESNEHAAEKVTTMRADLPPVRHVNCGLLPTSKDSWEVAFTVLDPVRGGWIHVHENFDQREIESKGEEVRAEFQRKLDVATGSNEKQVLLEYINRVKTYAPGVYHVVLDIYIPPRQAP